MRLGLGTYLALAFSLLSILVTAVLLAVSERQASRQVRASIGSNLAELANQTTSRLDRSMFERYREVKMMAGRLAAENDPGRIRAEMEAIQKSYPNYAWIGLTDIAGRVQVATGGLLEGADVSKRDWFRNAMEGRNMGDVHEAVLLAKLLANPGGEPLRFVDIAFRIHDAQGRPSGVLGVHLSWQWAREIEKAIFLQVGRSRTVEPLIVSQQGIVLLGPPDVNGRELELPSLQAAGIAPGYRTERWPDGKEYLVGYGRDKGYLDYPGLGWRVLVRQELGEAYQPVDELQARLALSGAAVALLFSLLGWAGSRLITSPLIGLADAARRLEAGEPAVADASQRYREINQLGTAFNSLVANLQHKEGALRELNASLERRVMDRTAELQEALEQVRENVQRVQSIIESAPDPFIGTDFHGRITDWNSRAEAVLGWKREEVMGRSLAEVLLPQRYAASTQQALASFLSTGDTRFLGHSLERVVVDRHGRELQVEVRIGMIDQGKLKLLSAFLRDISQRKEVERLKNEFVSTVSHELRTPLTAIYGSLSLLGAGVAGELPEEAQRLVQLSNQSCERLIRLVNDVLDVEKIESGKIRYELKSCNLRNLVEQAIRDVQPYADQFGVMLKPQQLEEAQVEADGDRIVQVMVNLLSNASKFSPAGGQVEVEMMVAPRQVRVGVTDHGPGVPDAFRDRVFERFAQADATDGKQKGGTGLGLNICRSIVQGHRGTIGFTSEPGHTTFWFELPLSA